MKRLLSLGMAIVLSVGGLGCGAGAKQEPIEELATPEQKAARAQREQELMRMQQQAAPQMLGQQPQQPQQQPQQQ